MKFNPQLDWSVKYSAFFHTQYLCMYVFQKILKLWNHYLPLSVQILQICGSPLKILGTRMGISRMSNTEDPSILGANLQNSAARGPWRTWFLYPCTYLHNINRQVFVKKGGVFFWKDWAVFSDISSWSIQALSTCINATAKTSMIDLNLSDNRQNQSMVLTRVFITIPAVPEEVNQ